MAESNLVKSGFVCYNLRGDHAGLRQLRSATSVTGDIMNRNILCFCIGLVFFLTGPAMTQISGTPSTKASPTKTKKIKVKDYKSFKEYVSKEEAALKVKPLTADTGTVLGKLENMGVKFSKGDWWAEDIKNKRTAFMSPNKRRISLVDWKTKKIEIFNASGDEINTVVLPNYNKGTIVSAPNRLYVMKTGFGECDGFEVYDYSGILQSKHEGICITRYMISNTEKYFAVTGGSQDGKDFLVTYNDMGVELWRHSIVPGNENKILFSVDDAYVSLESSAYWDENNSFVTIPRVYVFDVKTGVKISEENL